MAIDVVCRYGTYSQSNYARLRLMDSTGQTFQFTYAEITWTGWKYVFFYFFFITRNYVIMFNFCCSYVSLSLTNGGFWGGANDGIMHLPLKFEDIFLLDTTRNAQTSTVYFTPPVLVS